MKLLDPGARYVSRTRFVEAVSSENLEEIETIAMQLVTHRNLVAVATYYGIDLGKLEGLLYSI